MVTRRERFEPERPPFRHRYATRLNSFGPPNEAIRSLEQVAAIPGITAVEFNFPEHADAATGAAFLAQVRALGLQPSAMNMRYDPRRFRHGAFTNPDPSPREEALALTRAAVDLCAAEGVPHLILWMGPDGFDYPFTVDYAQLWQLEIDGFREIAQRQPGVLVSVEYKPNDPRRLSLIRAMGEALLAVREVDLPNFGVTFDLCHGLMTGESPAAAVSLALQSGRLFGLHLNDGYGSADDGLMIGSVHGDLTLELLLVLRQHDFRGTIYFDTFPERIDAATECALNIAAVEELERVLDRIDLAALRAAQGAQDSAAAARIVREARGA